MDEEPSRTKKELEKLFWALFLLSPIIVLALLCLGIIVLTPASGH